MTMTTRLFTYIAILLGAHAAQAQSTEKLQDLPITVAADKVFEGQLFAFGKDVVIEGKVHGDVGAILGDILVRGSVDGNISVLRGSVEIAEGAEFEGNIVCVGGSIDIPPTLQPGKLVNLFGPERASRSTRYLGAKSQAAIFFARMLFLFLIVIALYYFFPNQVREASFELSQDPGRCILMGLVTLTAFVIGLFISFLLMVIAIGIPLFLILGGALTICAVFGLVVVFIRISQLIRGPRIPRMPIVWSILIAVVIVGLLSLIPMAGHLIQLIILVLGTGAAILTRFGTNKAWFTKRRRFWSAD